jgi:hypothetical protein
MKKIVAIITILVLGAIVLWYMTGSGTDTGTLSVQSQGTQSSDAREISNLLQRMESVKLNNQIFSKLDVFTDNTVTLSAPTAGRNNPFAPLGSVSSVQSSQKTNTTKTTNQSSAEAELQ